MADCPNCGGSGKVGRFGGPNSSQCSTCRGSGKVAGSTRSKTGGCFACDGTGYRMRLGGPNSSGPCVTCGGSGRGEGKTRRTPRQTVSPVNLSEELGKLAQLHAAGVLTDVEFRLAKAKLLGN